VRRYLLLISAFLYFELLLFSVPPIPELNTKNYPKDHVSKKFLKKRLKAKQNFIEGSPSFYKASGTIGTLKLAVILVDFPSAGDNYTSGDYTMSQEDIKNFNVFFSSFVSYYDEDSYGKLNIDVYFCTQEGVTKTLTGNETPFVLDYSMSYYGQDTETSLSRLVRDALIKANGTISSFDYDTVMVAHAGYGNESTVNSGDIWSVFITWDNATYGFTEGTIVPAREDGGNSALGVICHEFGHQLGLVDLYRTDGSNASVAGKWALMDSGVWNNSGKTPPHMMNFNKWYLGWLTPTEITQDSKKNIYKYEVLTGTTPLIYKIPIINSSPYPEKEFFLLSYRKKEGQDLYLPDSGILIWHIDLDKMGLDENFNIISGGNWENNTINNDTSHYSIAYEGDGVFKEGETFTDSSSYLGGESGIIVTDFRTLSDSNYMSFTLDTVSMENTFVLKDSLNYPNPAKTNTKIQLTLSKTLPTDSKIQIFSLNGKLIREIPREDITYSINNSTDYNIKYEYDWNLKDENGNKVPSGIYFYVIRVGDEKKVNKIAIVR